MLRLITLWPFDKVIIGDLAGNGVSFLVPEMNLGQLAELVSAAAGASRVHSLSQVNGTTIPPARILSRIEEII
jgi:pyruvate/2-oxoacid:ferredoxin oxidoreductase alpha subunit